MDDKLSENEVKIGSLVHHERLGFGKVQSFDEKTMGWVVSFMIVDENCIMRDWSLEVVKCTPDFINKLFKVAYESNLRLHDTIEYSFRKLEFPYNISKHAEIGLKGDING